jgi:hypothetical protein
LPTVAHLDLASGTLVAGATTRAVTRHADGSAGFVGDDARTRPVTFAERMRCTGDALAHDRPERALGVALWRTGGGGAPPEVASEVLALVLAGAGVDPPPPPFATVARDLGAQGWPLDEVMSAHAADVDALARGAHGQHRPEDGWHRIVFADPPSAAASIEEVRDQLAHELLLRADAAVPPPTATSDGATSSSARVSAPREGAGPEHERPPSAVPARAGTRAPSPIEPDVHGHTGAAGLPTSGLPGHSVGSTHDASRPTSAPASTGEAMAPQQRNGRSTISTRQHRPRPHAASPARPGSVPATVPGALEDPAPSSDRSPQGERLADLGPIEWPSDRRAVPRPSDRSLTDPFLAAFSPDTAETTASIAEALHAEADRRGLSR